MWNKDITITVTLKSKLTIFINISASLKNKIPNHNRKYHTNRDQSTNCPKLLFLHCFSPRIMLEWHCKSWGLRPAPTIHILYLKRICNNTAISAIIAAITVALGCVSQGSFCFRRRFSIMFFLSFYLVISLALIKLYHHFGDSSTLFLLFYKKSFLFGDFVLKWCQK